MADLGNPNFFKVFKGRYSYTDSSNNTHYAMLSCTNEVIFMDSLSSDANKLICTLPAELRPTSTLYIPARYNGGNSYIVVNTNGKVTGGTASKTYYLNGISFNICANYYA